MKLYGPHGEEAIVTWGDHWPSCDKCREVSLEKSATFSNVCAQGAPLLSEELTKQQAPIVKAKTQAVKEWAGRAGTFPIAKSPINLVKSQMKYK